MISEVVYCPLLSKEIEQPLCLRITYAAEGRISPSEVTEVSDWPRAQDVCADCGNAYWNRNNLEPPPFVRDKEA